MHSYGIPGGSLDGDADFGTRRKVATGRDGELRCAKLLARTFRSDPNVWAFHDLNVPGTRANIDHALVRGRQVVLIDAKRWKAGIYWTAGGTTRRGTEPVSHADGRGLATGLDVIRRALRDAAVFQPDLDGIDPIPVTLIFPTSSRLTSTVAYRPADGGRAHQGTPRAMRRLKTLLDGDPAPCRPLLDIFATLVRRPDRYEPTATAAR